MGKLEKYLLIAIASTALIILSNMSRVSGKAVIKANGSVFLIK